MRSVSSRKTKAVQAVQNRLHKIIAEALYRHAVSNHLSKDLENGFPTSTALNTLGKHATVRSIMTASGYVRKDGNAAFPDFNTLRHLTIQDVLDAYDLSKPSAS